MVKFNDKHKEEMSGQYLGKGVHKVKIMMVEFGETEKGQEYVEFTVANKDGAEGTARMWFTTDKATQWTFNVIRTIFVHNTAEDKRDAMRKKIDTTKDTKELEEICQKLIGKDCWYKVEEDPDRTYTATDGNVRPSLNKNVYGFEPTMQQETPASVSSDDNESNSEEKDEPFGDF